MFSETSLDGKGDVVYNAYWHDCRDWLGIPSIKRVYVQRGRAHNMYGHGIRTYVDVDTDETILGNFFTLVSDTLFYNNRR